MKKTKNQIQFGKLNQEYHKIGPHNFSRHEGSSTVYRSSCGTKFQAVYDVPGLIVVGAVEHDMRSAVSALERNFLFLREIYDGKISSLLPEQDLPGFQNIQ